MGAAQSQGSGMGPWYDESTTHRFRQGLLPIGGTYAVPAVDDGGHVVEPRRMNT